MEAATRFLVLTGATTFLASDFRTHSTRTTSSAVFPSFRSSTRKIISMAVKTSSVPTWEDLNELLDEQKEPPFRLSHVKTRTFGGSSEQQQQQPALTFYRDNSSWCPYCQRVWIQLEEKQIPYNVEKINMNCYGPKPDWYLQMIPSGLLPAIKLDNKIIPESLDIMMILEKAFPNHTPLLPPASLQDKQAAVPALLKQERRLVGAWLGCLRGGLWGSVNSLEKALGDVNASLQRFGGPYFLGEEFSLVDAVYAPFLERIAASVPYWIGPKIRGSGKWPALDAWFDAMDSRPSYQAVKSDDFTITHTLEPQIGKCRVLPEGAAYRALIDGKDGSWNLPLKPEVTAWGFDDGTGGGFAKLEAAGSLIKNHEGIVGFASRAFNNPVPSTTSAVSLGFRYVSYALLVGVENAGDPPPGLSKDVAIAAAYLRDRIGVPRDLTYPAARQLRAHLHWLVKLLGSEL